MKNSKTKVAARPKTKTSSPKIASDIKDASLAESGRRKIEWAGKQMGVLDQIKSRFAKEKKLTGVRVSACLHVTSETANLMRTLKDGGADVVLCASNPLSTQDDVAASLVHTYGIKVFAIRGENNKSYYNHIYTALDHKPEITLDDGGDLIGTIHKERRDLIGKLIASMEETTTGLVRLRAMEKAGELKVPVFAVNDAHTKFLFDNRYGTGQSTLDGIVRATNSLIAGKTFVVCGYGWCGRGFANRARGMGAKVIVTEIDSIKALEATMDGFAIMPIAEAAKIGDIFCTLTGNKSVLVKDHFQDMKDGAIVCNSGHFNVEIDIDGLKQLTKETKRDVRPGVDSFTLKNGKTIFLLAEGRLVNLACAEGHPPEVMDMSFSTQALMVEYGLGNRGKLKPRIYDVPKEIESWIARLKLKTMGIEIDTVTKEQKTYMSSWQEGT